MLKDLMNDSSVNRLKQILADRYGKALEIRQLLDVSADAGAEEILVKGADLHIPLKVSDAFLGTAVIPRGGDLEDGLRKQVAQMVRMVLEPTLYNVYLERKETNLHSLSSDGFTEVSNLEIFEDAPAPDLESATTERPPVLSHLIHLQGRRELQVRKVAHTLHEMAERWAFVPFSDLTSKLHSADDIVKLGAMTILIEDVETLPTAAQDLVREYLSKPRGLEEPLFITTSKIDTKELAESGRLNAELSDEILINSFDTDRAPVTGHGLKEVLDLLFFQGPSTH